MFERSEMPLKICCGAIGLFLLYRLVLVVAHINPLYHLAIPALPTLAASASSSAGGGITNPPAPTKPATNLTQHGSIAASTNTAGSNVIARANDRKEAASNVVVRATNLLAHATNLVVQATNVAAHATNSIAQTTNSSQMPLSGKNAPMGRPPELGRRGMPGGFPPGMPQRGPELAPELQTRIDRVIDSEILAPVMRPMPMALLGIAGKDVFLRAPNGQTGLVKEGEELGGVKLVRIGINRVLVEEQGERKELTIFAGLGGESLSSTQKDSPK